MTDNWPSVSAAVKLVQAQNSLSLAIDQMLASFMTDVKQYDNAFHDKLLLHSCGFSMVAVPTTCMTTCNACTSCRITIDCNWQCYTSATNNSTAVV